MPVPLASEEAGQGPPILLLHGLGRNAADLCRLADRLTPHARVVRADLRGHGRSPDGTWTTAAATEDLVALIDRLALDRPAVVGHSLGGMLAAVLAARPGLLRAAVNLDGHGGRAAEQFPDLPPDRVAEQLAERRRQGLAQLPAAPLSPAELAAARSALRTTSGGDADHLLAVLDRSVDAAGCFRPG